MAIASTLLSSSFRSLPSPPIPNPSKGDKAFARYNKNLFYNKFLHVRRFPSRENSCSNRHFTLFASMVGRKAMRRETVIPDPDYRIPAVLLGLAGVLVYKDNLLSAAPVCLLGLLLLFQTTRVRFVFDKEALEVKVGDQLQESGENVFVGGKNRWKYSTFVNWELWWPEFPILVYFKETQTKPEGQVHFFPVIFNGKQLYDVMVERAGPSKTSGPKQSS
ncbi:hypothetical protein MRB53_004877 [Persea americana]|uniref:Uncharacterized protein n=1 Tax=Persea americana TaxID=3435 RepID=A0ACC2MBY8_PERAE|nr:hypothetical protein MRB53_004877 [Persea americana]